MREYMKCINYLVGVRPDVLIVLPEEYGALIHECNVHNVQFTIDCNEYCINFVVDFSK